MEGLADTRERLARLQRRAFVAGAIGLAAIALAGVFDLQRALQSWLVAWLVVLGVPLGALAIVLLHALTAGAWGLPIRRVLEAAARTRPLVALLGIPVLAGVRWIYPWPSGSAGGPAAWLQVPAFVVRALVYFAVWIGLVALADRLARRHDAEPGTKAAHRLRLAAGPSLALYAVTMTLAAIDWGMSLEPSWHSTVYGLIFLVGQVLAAFCFAIVVAAALRERAPFATTIEPRHFHDLGNLTLSFVLLWAYVSFSQFLIVWSANLPVEATWYVRRLHGGWQAIALLLVVAHFAAPFVILLSRRVKKDARRLAGTAAVLLAMRAIDVEWLIAPAFDAAAAWRALDLAALLAAGGLWLGEWCRQTRRRTLEPPLPLTDPVPAPSGGVS